MADVKGQHTPKVREETKTRGNTPPFQREYTRNSEKSQFNGVMIKKQAGKFMGERSFAST